MMKPKLTKKANKKEKISAGAADRAAAILAAGGVGILPTDTLYGVVGSALDKKVVERIYRLRERNAKKPMIVLIGAIADLKLFGVTLNKKERALAQKVWPGKVSVVMPIASTTPTRKFTYLHRGTKTLAFRLPEPAWLRAILKKTGPLVAPSANIEGKPPAKTIAEAKKYFGASVEFYANAGRRVSRPSTIVKIEGGKLSVLRRGAGEIKKS
jgi:L-threonylcarbamoyladenylate synthase